MTACKYSTSLVSQTARGLAAILTPDVRETTAVMGGQKPVSLY
jgi:hypothetical protein